FSNSADRQGALHSGLSVTRDAAEERVLAGLEVRGEGLRATCERRRGADLRPAGINDRHVVGQARRVGELDRVVAGLGGQRTLRELEAAAGVRGVGDRAPATATAPAARGRR